MSRKNRQTAARPQNARAGQQSPAAASAAPAAGGEGGGNSRKSRVLWLIAFILVLSGYAALGKVDPWGRNAWATAAPALLLAGYLLMIPAILITFRRSS